MPGLIQIKNREQTDLILPINDKQSKKKFILNCFLKPAVVNRFRKLGQGKMKPEKNYLEKPVAK